MSSLLLAIHTFPAANAALKRHWPYFDAQQADEVWIIGTTTGDIWVPDGAKLVRIAEDRYMDGKHLPRRLCDTFDQMSMTDHTHLMVVEYDTLIFKPIRWQAMEHAAASHVAGHLPQCSYCHNPWLMMSEAAKRFVEIGREAIEKGVCPYGSHESSPDVFWALMMQWMEQPVQNDLWREFSRNSLDCAGDLDRAKAAYLDGMDVIHGIKKLEELEYILANDA